MVNGCVKGTEIWKNSVCRGPSQRLDAYHPIAYGFISYRLVRSSRYKSDQGNLYRFYSWKSDVKIENNKVALEACFSKRFSLKICQAYVDLLDSRQGKSIDDIDSCKSYLFHYIKYRWNFKLFSIRVLSSGQTGLGPQNLITRFPITFTRSNRPILVQPTIDHIYVGANFETPCSQRRNFVILGALSF